MVQQQNAQSALQSFGARRWNIIELTFHNLDTTKANKAMKSMDL